jgi:prepilin-type N-terminal cleavage/methylation domain-containing protein
MRRKREQGYSLVEILVVTAIVGAVLIMAYEMIDDAARTSIFVETRNELPVLAQSAINYIQAETFQARTIFDADPAGVGPGYLAAVQLPASYPLLTDSHLPLADASGDLVPDSTTAYTGNCLLLARQLSPISVSIGGGQRLLADRYQFEMIYLTKQTTHSYAGAPYYVDLIRAKSAPVADYFQLSQLTTTQSQAANTDLLAAAGGPITQAWDPGQPIASALYDIKRTGQYTATATPSINLTAEYGTLLKGLTGGRISGKADYSVAFRPSGTKRFPINDLIPKYALFDPAKPLFPSGAEFLIAGPSGSRRALARVVLMANYNVGQMSSKEVETITAVP